MRLRPYLLWMALLVCACGKDPDDDVPSDICPEEQAEVVARYGEPSSKAIHLNDLGETLITFRYGNRPPVIVVLNRLGECGIAE